MKNILNTLNSQVSLAGHTYIITPPRTHIHRVYREPYTSQTQVHCFSIREFQVKPLKTFNYKNNFLEPFAEEFTFYIRFTGVTKLFIVVTEQTSILT